MRCTHPRNWEATTESKRAVLRVLQDDSDRAHKVLAHIAGVSEPTFSRIRAAALENGIIKGVVTLLSRDGLGLQALGFFRITCDNFRATQFAGEVLKDIPGVLEVHITDGTHSLFAKICAKSPAGLDDIRSRVLSISGVTEVRVQIVMKTVFETTCLPV